MERQRVKVDGRSGSIIIYIMPGLLESQGGGRLFSHGDSRLYLPNVACTTPEITSAEKERKTAPGREKVPFVVRIGDCDDDPHRLLNKWARCSTPEKKTGQDRSSFFLAFIVVDFPHGYPQIIHNRCGEAGEGGELPIPSVPEMPDCRAERRGAFLQADAYCPRRIWRPAGIIRIAALFPIRFSPQNGNTYETRHE